MLFLITVGLILIGLFFAATIANALKGLFRK
jgi:uncharacterized membrane protein YiaA